MVSSGQHKVHGKIMDIKIGYVVMKVVQLEYYGTADIQACCQNTEEEALRWIAAELGKPEYDDNIKFYIRKVFMRTPKKNES